MRTGIYHNTRMIEPVSDTEFSRCYGHSFVPSQISGRTRCKYLWEAFYWPITFDLFSGETGNKHTKLEKENRTTLIKLNCFFDGCSSIYGQVYPFHGFYLLFLLSELHTSGEFRYPTIGQRHIRFSREECYITGLYSRSISSG